MSQAEEANITTTAPCARENIGFSVFPPSPAEFMGTLLRVMGTPLSDEREAIFVLTSARAFSSRHIVAFMDRAIAIARGQPVN